MKKISLFILAALGMTNTVIPMAKSKTFAKANPAAAVATAKLQAKPVLFFDASKINPEMDGRSGKSSSEEMKDLIAEWNKLSKEISFEQEKATQEWNVFVSKFNDHLITWEQYLALGEKYNSSCKDFNNKSNTLSAHYLERSEDVRKKIEAIKLDIAKRLGACAVYDLYEYCSMVLIDPAYDITQEVFDRLNKEYQESQSKIKICSHCCDVHCPTKCDTHCAKTH